MKSITLAGVLVLALASGSHPAFAQNKKSGNKSEDTAKQPSGPTIEQTQEFIAGLFADPAKASPASFSMLLDGEASKKEISFRDFSFKGNCKAIYYAFERKENVDYRHTTRRKYSLDFSRLVPYVDPNDNERQNLFFRSRDGIEEIPYKADVDDERKPDFSFEGNAKRVWVAIHFNGVFREKADKAFKHLEAECQKVSGKPKDLF